MGKSDEYYQFLEDLAQQIDKEKKEKKIVDPGVILDCNELPVGSAIIWKMKYIKFDDWDQIPLKEIAIAKKEGLNMVKFAEDFGVKLIKRDKYKFKN